MTRALLLATVCVAGMCAPQVRSQSPAHVTHQPPPDSGRAVEEFVRRAREGTERYKDQSVAVEDGYRRLGPDFPAMGEHWANPELVAKGVLDAARPALLTYARVRGVPTLTGVVYAIPLGDGEQPPASPFDAADWHDHLGSVEEESMLLHHEARPTATSGLRLAVLHLWTWVDNPAGRSVTDNWALPFARLGVAAPAAPSLAAARAMSLLSGAMPYYTALARSAGSPSASEQHRIDAALARCADRVGAWWTARASSASVTPGEIATLDEIWKATWREIDAAVAPDVARRLRPVWQP